MARAGILILVFVAIGVGLIFAGSDLARKRPLAPTPLDAFIAQATHLIAAPDTSPTQRASAYYSRAQAYRLQGNPAAAVADYRAILSMSGLPRVFTLYARAGLIGAYREERDYADAMTVWKQATAGRKIAPTDLMIRGVLYTDMGDYAHAESDLDTAEKVLPFYAPVQIARYQLFLDEGAYDKALVALDRVEQLAPYYPGVHRLRAWVYLHELDPVDAWREYNTLDHKMNAQQQLRVVAMRAQQEFKAPNLDAGIADCTAILAAQPNAWRYRLMRGELYSWKGDTAHALVDIKAVEEDQPVSTLVLADLGSVYFHAQRFEEAARALRAARAFTPNKSTLYRSHGTVEFALGNYQDAVTDFSAALSDNPRDAYSVIWLHLSRTRMHADDKTEFANNSARITDQSWPRPIIDYMAGTIDLGTLTAQANNATLSGTLRDQNCEEDYYTGLMALDRGDRATGLTNLRSAARSCHPGFFEHTMAAWAIKQAG